MQRKIGFTQTNIIASATAQGRTALFIAALTFVLPQEGVYYEQVAGDAGGATCCGITQEDYNQYRHEQILPKRSVEQITALEVASVYYAHYWVLVHGDYLPAGLGLVLFDAAVNTGIGHAIKWLQGALGITVDGGWGQGTSDALHAYIDAHGGDGLIRGVMARRVAFYNEIGAPGKTDHQFLAGWLSRCADLEKALGS